MFVGGQFTQAILRRIDRLRRASRRFAARLNGISLPGDARLESGVHLGPGPFSSKRGDFHVGRRFHADVGALLYTYSGSITIGDDVYIGPYSVIYGHGGVTIGSGTAIAMSCSILSSNHAIPPRGVLIRSLPDEVAPTVIGADCWLGAGAVVLAGVTIGDGCVIGAGTVVTSDLPPYAVAVGVPANVVRFREEHEAREQQQARDQLAASRRHVGVPSC